jgi:hypothetical protein
VLLIALLSIIHSPQNNRAGIVQWYSAGLRGGLSGVRVPAGAGKLSLHYRVQTGSEAHPASYPMGTRGSFPGGVKRPGGREPYHSPPSSAEVKNARSYTSTPQYTFKAWCSVKAQGQIYIYLYPKIITTIRNRRNGKKHNFTCCFIWV